MIRPLRSAHRAAVVALAVVVVPLFVIGLRARRIDTRGPAGLPPAQAASGQGGWSVWDCADLAARRNGAGWTIVARSPLVAADPLVYRHAGNVRCGDPLPDGATFLGAFRSGETFEASSGTLFLFSLATGEVVATWEVGP